MLGEAHLAPGEKWAPRFTLRDVAENAGELMVLSGSHKGPLTHLLSRQHAHLQVVATTGEPLLHVAELSRWWEVGIDDC